MSSDSFLTLDKYNKPLWCDEKHGTGKTNQENTEIWDLNITTCGSEAPLCAPFTAQSERKIAPLETTQYMFYVNCTQCGGQGSISDVKPIFTSSIYSFENG